MIDDDDPTPMAVSARMEFPLYSRVRLYDGRLGLVMQRPRDVWQQFGGDPENRVCLGVEIAVQPDDKAYDIWFGINQVTRED